MGFVQKYKAIKDHKYCRRSSTPDTCLLPILASRPDNAICQGGGWKNTDWICNTIIHNITIHPLQKHTLLTFLDI